MCYEGFQAFYCLNILYSKIKNSQIVNSMKTQNNMCAVQKDIDILKYPGEIKEVLAIAGQLCLPELKEIIWQFNPSYKELMIYPADNMKMPEKAPFFVTAILNANFKYMARHDIVENVRNYHGIKEGTPWNNDAISDIFEKQIYGLEIHVRPDHGLGTNFGAALQKSSLNGKLHIRRTVSEFIPEDGVVVFYMPLNEYEKKDTISREFVDTLHAYLKIGD